MNRFLLIAAVRVRCPAAAAIARSRRRRWCGSGASNRRRIRRDLAQSSGRDCRQHVRGDDVLDAAQAVELADLARGLDRDRAVRRMPRLSRILSTAPRRSIASKVCKLPNPRETRSRGRWGGSRAHRGAAAFAPLPLSNLCADRAARGAEQKVTSPARARARAGIPSPRCDVICRDRARQGFAPPLPGRRETRDTHRGDSLITRPPSLAIGHGRHAGRA